MRAVDRNHIHARQHLVEAFPIRRLHLGFQLGAQAAAIVIMHGHAEALGAARDRRADAAHADDAKALAENPVTQHVGRTPSLEGAGLNHLRAFHDPPGHRHDQRHGHVGGVLCQHAWRVRHKDALRAGTRHVDMVYPVAEIGDQLQARAGLGDHCGVDMVGEVGDQDVAAAHGRDQFVLTERMIVDIQADVEQLHHPRLDDIGEFSGDDDCRLRARHLWPRWKC